MNFKLRFKQTLVIVAIMFLGTSVFAQKSVLATQKLQDESKVTTFKVSDERGTPRLINLNATQDHRLSKSDAPTFLRQALGLNQATTISKVRENQGAKGTEIVKYQQYFRGIKVEHGVYNALAKSGTLQAFTLEHYDIDENLAITPSLSEEAALQSAIDFVGATEYAWDYYNLLKMNEQNPQRLAQIDQVIDALYPTGELVIVDDYSQAGINMNLAYKFNVYAAEPLYRADIYVDAQTGGILLADQDIKHAAEVNESIAEGKRMATFAMVLGSGDTRYAGNRQFETTLLEPDTSDPLNIIPQRYVLDGVININAFNPNTGQTEAVTVLNETRSYDGVGGVPVNLGGSLESYEITDGSARNEETQTTTEIADNMWTLDEHYRDRFETPADNYPVDNEFDNDDVALDAHWGSETVIRYWGSRHNRWSFDGEGEKITSFVHYGDGYDNAFYSSSTMTYGDGSSQGGSNPNGSFAPLMSMDVAAHEIGHGVCDFTSDLVYARQSGGMNEGFSDIWAAAVEAYVIAEVDPSLSARYQPYGIGEQIDDRDGGIEPEDNDPNMRALRFMDDPNAAGDPECLEGVNWVDTSEEGCPAPNLGNDQCGVHSNSGVLNKWFYLLVEGSGQAMTPGRSKRTVDDEVNDNGDPYSVEGLGFLVGEQIAFRGEVLLTPNATFMDMRDASILVAQQEYGVDSNEEIQTTNAWHAICVGETYITPEPNQVFFSSGNVSTLQEKNDSVGCRTSRVYDVVVSTVQVSPAVNVTLDTSASTATEGVDFMLSTSTLTLEGSENQAFQVTVFDDALVEIDELINISFEFDGEVKSQEITLVDDDVVPTIGSSVIEVLPIEEFSSTTIPDGWEEKIVVDPSQNKWYYNGAGTESGRAYISFTTPAGTTNSARYESNSPSNVILMSPELTALGLNDVRVTFDWEAGGELNPGLEPYDFGQLVYSFDGINFEEGSERFATTEEGVRGGTFDEIIPDLANTRFYIGFRWFNDTNATTSDFSFAIDNVSVSALPANIETQLDETTSLNVGAGEQIYFLSDSDNGVMAMIENASADLGCVNMVVSEEGTAITNNSNVGVNRASKVIQIEADGIDAATATYDITFFYTADELAEFSNATILQVMKVEGNDIDAATSANTVISGSIQDDLIDTEGYASFKGTFTGFSSFTIVEEATAGVNDINVSGVAIYPSPVSVGDIVTISTQGILIANASIFDVRGARVLNQNFDNIDTAQLSTAGLQTGFYFVRLNNDTNKTFKFIVK